MFQLKILEVPTNWVTRLFSNLLYPLTSVFRKYSSCELSIPNFQNFVLIYTWLPLFVGQIQLSTFGEYVLLSFPSLCIGNVVLTIFERPWPAGCNYKRTKLHPYFSHPQKNIVCQIVYYMAIQHCNWPN